MASCYHGVQTIKPGVGELATGRGVSASNRAHGKQRNEIIGKLDKKVGPKMPNQAELMHVFEGLKVVDRNACVQLSAAPVIRLALVSDS